MDRVMEICESWINGNRTWAAKECRDNAALAVQVGAAIAAHDSPEQAVKFAALIERTPSKRQPLPKPFTGMPHRGDSMLYPGY